MSLLEEAPAAFLYAPTTCAPLCVCVFALPGFSVNWLPLTLCPAGTKVKPNLAFDNDSTALSSRKQHLLTARATSGSGISQSSRWACSQANLVRLPVNTAPFFQTQSRCWSSSITSRRGALTWDNRQWKSSWKPTGFAGRNQQLLEKVVPWNILPVWSVRSALFNIFRRSRLLLWDSVWGCKNPKKSNL